MVRVRLWVNNIEHPGGLTIENENWEPLGRQIQILSGIEIHNQMIEIQDRNQIPIMRDTMFNLIRMGNNFLAAITEEDGLSFLVSADVRFHNPPDPTITRNQLTQMSRTFFDYLLQNRLRTEYQRRCAHWERWNTPIYEITGIGSIFENPHLLHPQFGNINQMPLGDRHLIQSYIENWSENPIDFRFHQPRYIADQEHIMDILQEVNFAPEQLQELLDFPPDFRPNLTED